MKKRKLLICLLLCIQSISMPAIAQFIPYSQMLNKYQVIDTCLYKAYYQLEMFPTPQNRNISENDIQLLEIGKNVLKNSSYLLYQKDSLTTDMFARGLSNGVLVQQTVLPIETYITKSSHNTTLSYRTFFGGPVLRYTEPTQDIEWQITNTTDTILNYICQKAICQFRGRTYHAWFTMDIPFNAGPYKFHGLPGLILKISDNNNEYVWTCIKFNKAGSDELIKEYKWQFDDVSRQKMETAIERMYNNPFKFCESLGMKFQVRTAGGGWGARGTDVALPYNPIEK